MLCSCFAAFGAADIQVYQEHFEKSATEISDSCIASRIAWNAGFNYQKAVIAGLYCLISDGGTFTTPHLVMPIGKADQDPIQAVMDEVTPHFEHQGWPMRVLYIDECYLPLFRSLNGYRAQINSADCFSDYIYDASKLIALSGKSLHAKRNHVNRFFRDYSGYAYHRLTVDDRNDCLNLVSEWCAEKCLDCMNLLESDYLAIRMLFDHFEQLTVRGGLIRIGGCIAAFAIGSVNRSTGIIHFEKARTDIDGLYAVINKLVIEHEFSDCVEINREEDMGIEGLRKAKQSYSPARMVRKYEAILIRD